MSKVVSLRLHDQQVQRLGRLARRLGRTPSEAAALLLEEALRQAEFALIQFRDSPVGRQAYVQGTSLAVWEVAMVAKAFDNDPGRTAAHLELPPLKIQAALGYAEAYPAEIAEALADNDRPFAELKRLLPNIELITIDAAAS
ncbi:MAG: transcriptional regulator [Chloroflexi bacterium]|nr:transcriptional regulator [Chloroflexota bacterium]